LLADICEQYEQLHGRLPPKKELRRLLKLHRKYVDIGRINQFVSLHKRFPNNKEFRRIPKPKL